MINHGALFNGIGGFQIAASMMGWKNVFSSEIDEFCNRVTKYHFPNCIQHGDIKKTNFKKYANRIDVLTGGFPCQPYSTAGKRKGKEDDRHLWPQMCRAIKEIQPRWVIGENVLGLINWSGGLVFHEVQVDLETAGYEVWPYVLPACGVNAPHKRERIFFVARRIIKDTDRNGWSCNKWEEKPSIWRFRNAGTGNNEWLQADNRKAGDVANSECQGFQKSEQGEQFNKLSDAERNAVSGNASNPKSIQSGKSAKRKGRKNTLGGTIDNIRDQNEGRNVADTTDQGLQSDPRNEQREVYQANGSRQGSNIAGAFAAAPGWEEFPTQSPILGRDDGVPRKMDGITFSKWRNESIRAYGNAVVPAVVYQIFKAIELYEKHKNDKCT